MNKEQLYSNISEIRNHLTANGFTYPLNIFDICSKYANIAISSLPFKTKGLRGMAVLAKDHNDINCILVNSNISASEQNFHGMHELMHITFEDERSGQVFKCYEKTMPFQDAYKEWIANEGAAELLVPYADFIPFFCNVYADFRSKNGMYKYGNKDILTVLSSRYGVSDMVIKNRISSLSYEIDQFNRGISFGNMDFLSYTQQKRYGIVTTNYIDKIDAIMIQYLFRPLEWNEIIK